MSSPRARKKSGISASCKIVPGKTPLNLRHTVLPKESVSGKWIEDSERMLYVFVFKLSVFGGYRLKFEV